MKASAEKSSTSSSTPAARTPSPPFFAKAGGGAGRFFEPATPAPPIQTKLTVNQPGDKFEQEADRMADKIMRMPAPAASNERLQRQPDDTLQKQEDEKIQKAPAPEEKLQRAETTNDKLQKKEDDKLQREGGTGTPAVGAGTQAAIRQKTTGGHPLSADVRRYMEPRFGADFSQVRIHHDAEADSLSNQLSARAFTYQNHVFFARDQYQPGTGEGKQLLAHELTHTIQQGHAIQRKADASSSPQRDDVIQKAPAASKPRALSSEVVDISSNTFNPSEKVRAEIEAQGNKGLGVRIIRKGLTEEGIVKVSVDRGKNYDSIDKGSMLLLNAWTQQLGGLYINFSVKNSEIKQGHASLKPGGGNPNDWLLSLRKNAELLGGLGLKVGAVPTFENKFDNGKLTLGVKNLKVQVGGFIDALFNLALENNAKPLIDATADISVKGLAKGQLKLDNTQGKLAGEASLAIDFKAFSGSAQVKYNADGTVDIGGKAAYNANKLSGEIQFVATDVDSANSFARDAVAAAGGKENVQNASPPAPVPVPKPGKKKLGLAATGQLAFHLTTWFTGMVTVVVDGKGDVTVIGKIAPPAEIELFKQKDWDKELFKLEAKAYYGIPVVGNLNLFANISLHALAKLGPAKIYNIEVLGTYSTDPAIQKSIQLSASLNISAYAGLRLRAEGGAGIEILAHNLKFGIGVNADVGVQAYADARPTIGYRDPGQFYVSGVLEMVAQPMLGLGGDFFIALEAPWWSPLSDDKWTWPLFAKEWPLSDPIGISASVKDYVLGSGKVPEVELKKPEFDASKFMTSMVDQTLPAKSGGPGAGQGSFKEDGSAPKPVVPPQKPEPKKAAPKGASKKTPPKGGKSAAPNPKATAEQNTTKLLKTAVDRLTALKSKGPFGRAALNKQLAAISGVTFTVQPKGDQWLVTPKAGGKMSKKGVELGRALDKMPGKNKNDTRTDEQKKADLDRAVAEAETLLAAPSPDLESIRKQLPAIKSKFKLSVLTLIEEGGNAEETNAYVHAEINPTKDSKKNRIKKGTVGPLKITRKSLSFTADTKTYLIEKFKSSFPPGMLGQFKDAKLDIRHKISISDTIKHLDAALSPLKVEDAAKVLSDKGFAPKGKKRPDIIEAARELLQKANNDTANLFIGASGKNRRKGKRYDAGDAKKANAIDPKHDPQKNDFISTYGIENTDFHVTIDITVDGTQIETWKVLP
ncbi:DUF4157 domain-containing protein [Hymenobacter sp. BT664]|uniref:DUF4157 domain-containing protein n=1 Tax=Hymenobacter montanus TaxID=2771359 RepID=A0A927B915_9BACT|nr:DUF4157 domain-containing protein [Hymenobacter montanus]MBD2766357.1 DUF4157 domain-containing protein [Hymenobacter montanus]